MKRLIIKALSVFLTVIMIAGYLPMAQTTVNTSNNTSKSYVDTDTDADEEGTIKVSDLSVGDNFYFGLYPQTNITAELGDMLNTLAPEWDEWTSFEYYCGTGEVGSGISSDYMKYCDVEYNDSTYRGVKFTSYRPVLTYNTSSVSTSNQARNGYYVNTTYWFKFEPVQWCVLDPATGYVMSKMILDVQAFQNNYRCNGLGDVVPWEGSSLQEWLNGGFYNTAFTEDMKKEILLTSNNTSIANPFETGYNRTGYSQDYVFLLSYNESINASYGFSSSYSAKDINRCAIGTDYAKAQGLFVGTSYYTGVSASDWWLRSPRGWYGQGTRVTAFGNVDLCYEGTDSNIGIRPVMCIDSQSEIYHNDAIYFGFDRFSYCDDFGITLGETEESVIKYKSEEYDISDLTVTSSNPSVVKIEEIIPDVGSKTEIDLDENVHVATVKIKGTCVGTTTITVTAPNGLECSVDVTVKKREKQIVTFTTEKSMIIPTGNDMWLGFGLSDVKTGEIEDNWKKMAITISAPDVISLSDYELTEYGYSVNLKGLRAGQSNLVVTDTESGANTIITVTVRDKYKETYSYSVDKIAARPMGNKYEKEFDTNIYNLNGIYVCNYTAVKTETGYDVSFDAYNSLYSYGSVDIYDENAILTDYEAIKPYSDISSLFDTGERAYYLVTDLFNGELLTYKQDGFSQHSRISFSVPDGGYFTISNNVTESKGAFFANTFELLYKIVDNIIKFGGEGTKPGNVSKLWNYYHESFGNTLIKARNESLVSSVAKVLIDNTWDTVTKRIESFTKNLIKESSFDFATCSEFISSFSDIGEALLDSYGFDWKSEAKNYVGLGESVFSDLTGPYGMALDACFSFTKLTNMLLMTWHMAKSTNAQYITAYAGGNKDINPYGVIVDRQGNTDAEAVLQVFRVSNDDAVEVVLDSDNPLQKHELYNICFVKNDTTVQPNGKVKVHIPIPLGLKKDTCTVYRQEEDGSWLILDAIVEGNYLVFETDHFSLYAVVGDAYELIIHSLPSKTVYRSNEYIDTTGLVVQLANTILDGGYVISPRVVSGSGVQIITVSYGNLTATFNVEIQDTTEPADLTAPESVQLKNGEETQIEITSANAEGETVTITSDGAVVELSESSVTLDENGKAVITVKAIMPGTAELTFSLTMLTLTAKTTVEVRESDNMDDFASGDVNGDGQILANDARLALRASAQLERLDAAQTKAADVDEDGKILANDARQILRFSAKLQTEFKKASENTT